MEYNLRLNVEIDLHFGLYVKPLLDLVSNKDLPLSPIILVAKYSLNLILERISVYKLASS